MIMIKFAYFYSILFLFLFLQNSSAQLYVNNNYMYVGNSYVFVKQDVNLQATGNIYLRKEGQLLQGTTASSTNSGTGRLSIFQEGTTNNYAYNYWCSPVGNPGLTSGNDNFGISMLERPTGIISSLPATLAPTSVRDGTTTNTDLTIASRWIYKYLFSSVYAGWSFVGTGTSFAAGEGFTMKGVSGDDTANTLAIGEVADNNPVLVDAQRYDFKGKPNDGNILVSVQAGKRTLTGNPYASAIDLQRFLTLGASPNNPTAANCTGIAYFWEQDKTVTSHLLSSYKGGYGAYAAGLNLYTPPTFYAYDGAGTQLGMTGMGTNWPRQFSPIGQGFMIEGAATVIGTQTVTMSNDFRVFQKEGVLSHFERNASNGSTVEYGFLPAIPSVSGFDYTTVSTAPNPQIRFNTLMNNEAVRQVVLAFHPTATDGIDHAMDARSSDSSPMSMYFVINDAEYVIEAVGFDINKRIPIGFKNATPASFKITVCEILNFDGAENIYIHDKVTDVYYDIKDNEYEMSLPEGVNNTRYEITFVNGSLNVPVLADDSFTVFQNNTTQTLNIANPKGIDIKSINLYDISGKLIFNKSKLGTKGNFQFSTSSISDAVYVVKIITTNNQDFAKKVTVYNGK